MRVVPGYKGTTRVEIWRRVADLHHQRPWDDGGPTDLDNGFWACPRHHTPATLSL